MNQTHSKKFHCTYLLHYYPFDTQVLVTFSFMLTVTFTSKLILALDLILCLDLSSRSTIGDIFQAQCRACAKRGACTPA